MAGSSRNGVYFLPGLVIILGVIYIDQYTKWMVMETLLRPDGPSHVDFWKWLVTRNPLSFFVNERVHYKDIVVSPFLNLVMVWNQGISFGIMDHNSASSAHMALAFTALSLIISVAMIIWLALNARFWVSFGLSLIIGGALGNVLDRLRFHAVVDFIDAHYQQRHWPAFNVADSCIVAGAGILMLSSLFGKESTGGNKR